MSDNQIIIDKSNRLVDLRAKLGISQRTFAERIGTHQANYGKLENGKRPIGPNVEYKIIHEFGVNEIWWNTGEGEMFEENKNDYLEGNNITNARKIESYLYEELPYISRRARATFAELGQSLVESGEVYSVMKTDTSESLMRQVVIEIDGDSMEPYLISGAKVRCKEIDQGDWLYLNSGVYVVSYGNFVVVKRIKNSPINGTVMLHSDNTETGGNLAVPIGDIREIWKVLRIVDSPVR